MDSIAFEIDASQLNQMAVRISNMFNRFPASGKGDGVHGTIKSTRASRYP